MLTGVTVLVTGFDFGPLNLIVALGVAVTKASLVVLYFMHARYSPQLTGVVIASSIAFFVILALPHPDRLPEPALAAHRGRLTSRTPRLARPGVRPGRRPLRSPRA